MSLTEQSRFSRIGQYVTETIAQQNKEREEDRLKRTKEQNRLKKLIEDHELLTSDQVIEPLSAAANLLVKTSKSGVGLFITTNPDPNADKTPSYRSSAYESFYRNPDSYLTYRTPQKLLLSWNIVDEDIRGRPLGKYQWEQIEITTRRDEDGDLIGLKFHFGQEQQEHDCDLTPEGIHEAIDLAVSSPKRKLSTYVPYDHRNNKGIALVVHTTFGTRSIPKPPEGGID